MLHIFITDNPRPIRSASPLVRYYIFCQNWHEFWLLIEKVKLKNNYHTPSRLYNGSVVVCLWRNWFDFLSKYSIDVQYFTVSTSRYIRLSEIFAGNICLLKYRNQSLKPGFVPHDFGFKTLFGYKRVKYNELVKLNTCHIFIRYRNTIYFCNYCVWTFLFSK